MPSTVTQVRGLYLVNGVPPDPLKEALAEFVEHNAKTAKELLNVSGIGTKAVDRDGKVLLDVPVHQKEPRETYDPNAEKNQWPKMMYHADGREIIVVDAGEVKEAKGHGYRHEPYLKPQVAVLDPASEKKLLLDRLNQMEADKNQSADLALRLSQRVEELEGRFVALTSPKEKNGK